MKLLAAVLYFIFFWGGVGSVREHETFSLAVGISQKPSL